MNLKERVQTIYPFQPRYNIIAEDGDIYVEKCTFLGNNLCEREIITDVRIIHH